MKWSDGCGRLSGKLLDVVCGFIGSSERSFAVHRFVTPTEISRNRGIKTFSFNMTPTHRLMGLAISTEFLTKLPGAESIFVIDILRDIDIFIVQLSLYERNIRYYFRNNISFSLESLSRVYFCQELKYTEVRVIAKSKLLLSSDRLKLIKPFLCAWRRYYYLLFVDDTTTYTEMLDFVIKTCSVVSQRDWPRFEECTATKRKEERERG